jgi:hypothetical protein
MPRIFVEMGVLLTFCLGLPQLIFPNSTSREAEELMFFIVSNAPKNFHGFLCFLFFVHNLSGILND